MRNGRRNKPTKSDSQLGKSNEKTCANHTKNIKKQNAQRLPTSSPLLLLLLLVDGAACHLLLFLSWRKLKAKQAEGFWLMTYTQRLPAEWASAAY